MTEVDACWHAWVSWVQQAGGRYLHEAVSVGAAQVQQLEEPDSYAAVPGASRP